MDERNLQRMLQHIAETHLTEQEIEDMQLWNKLETQLDKTTSRPMRHSFRLAWVASAIVLLLVAGAVARAFVFDGDGQERPGQDPGIESVRDAGLITELNISRPVEDVTVTLDWGYADAHRIAIGVTVSGLDSAELAENETLAPGEASLLDANDPSIQFYSATGSISSLSEDNPAEISYEFTFFSTPRGEALEGVDEIDFDLELTLLIQNKDELLPPYEYPEFGSTRFAFTLPVYPAITVEPAVTVTASNLDLTLQKVVYTPSQTELQVCYELPDGRDWQLEPVLDIGQEEPAHLGGFGLEARPAYEDTERCANLRFLTPFTEEPATRQLVIDSLILRGDIFRPEDVARAQQALAPEIAFEVDIMQDENGGGSGLIISHKPDDMTEAEAQMAIMDAMAERIEGPWIFEIEVPEYPTTAEDGN
jgi:hypothetical protein